MSTTLPMGGNPNKGLVGLLGVVVLLALPAGAFAGATPAPAPPPVAAPPSTSSSLLFHAVLVLLVFEQLQLVRQHAVDRPDGAQIAAQKKAAKAAAAKKAAQLKAARIAAAKKKAAQLKAARIEAARKKAAAEAAQEEGRCRACPSRRPAAARGGHRRGDVRAGSSARRRVPLRRVGRRLDRRVGRRAGGSARRRRRARRCPRVRLLAVQHSTDSAARRRGRGDRARCRVGLCDPRAHLAGGALTSPRSDCPRPRRADEGRCDRPVRTRAGGARAPERCERARQPEHPDADEWRGARRRSRGRSPSRCRVTTARRPGTRSCVPLRRVECATSIALTPLPRLPGGCDASGAAPLAPAPLVDSDSIADGQWCYWVRVDRRSLRRPTRRR